MQLFPQTNITISISIDWWHWCCGGHPLPPHWCPCPHRHVLSTYSTAITVCYFLIGWRWMPLFIYLIIPVSICMFLCSGFYSCNTEMMPGIYNWTSAVQVTLDKAWLISFTEYSKSFVILTKVPNNNLLKLYSIEYSLKSRYYVFKLNEL